MNFRSSSLIKTPLDAHSSPFERSKVTHHFMVRYLGDSNPDLDSWADQLASHCSGQRLGGSYCRLSGDRTLQYGFSSHEEAMNAKDLFRQASLPDEVQSYRLSTSQVTDKGWTYPNSMPSQDMTPRWVG